ncbi:MFS transporter [Halovivax cerinus]|uniref:MFS transporter n=1 Tax=Halovivax cerinus TaxID=1487865 RepID=A0ABD5NQL6_9EURY|nr:MFS transporter [Halovivax cerinus]
MRGLFDNRTFRRLFAGRVITNLGDSLYFIGAMWLVYSLTGDPFYTGVAGFLTQGPAVFQFLAGPIVDRHPIRRLLVGTQLFQAVIVATIPIAHALDALTVWHVLAVMPILSAANQLVYPAQTAALPRIVDEAELVAANSAFSVAYQGFEMVANGIGGVIIGFVGAVSLFVIDAATFGIAALVFATLAIPPANAGDESTATDDGRTGDGVESGGGEPAADGGTPTRANDADSDDEGSPEDGSTDDHASDTTPPESDGYVDRLREGADVLRGTFLLPLVVAASILNVTGGMVMASIPAYADSLAVPTALSALGAAGAYGILMAAFAGGNFLGALAASAVSDRPFGYVFLASGFATGTLWTAGLLVDWLPLTALLFTLALVPVGTVNVQIATIVQTAPPEALVGRVSSLLGSASTAVVPVGALLGGIVAGALGPRAAMAGIGVAGLGQAVYLLANAEIRGLPPAGETSLDG